MKITGKELIKQLSKQISKQMNLATSRIAIKSDEEYEINEPMYEIKLPNLRTTDGEPQYLSRRKSGGSWFASRHLENLQQTFTEEELYQVPRAYKQYAERTEE